MSTLFVTLSLALQLQDWGGLIRYGSENTEVRPPAPGEQRVVFIGDDITESWDLARHFPGRPFFNRGIRGQTSPQMLVRFRQDVISLKPKVVVIQAGSNDLAGLTGPATQPMIAENFMSMVDLARCNGIRVVIASLTPSRLQSRPTGKILGVNDWLKDYAAETGSAYLDLYSALVSGRTFKPEFTTDGFHLTEAAYQALAPAAERAIASALSK